MTKRNLLPTAAATVACVMLAGCATGGSTGSAGAGESVTMVIGSDIGNLDPHLGTSNDLTQFKNFVYDRLLFLNDKSELVPWLASEWKATPRTIDMTIRKDVKCEDGAPLDAEVVARNFQHILEKGTGSPLRGGEMPVDMKVSADAATNVVHFETETDFPFLLERAAATPIVCKAGLDNRKAVATDSFGSGAYRLERVEAGSQYVLTRNDNYNSAPQGEFDGDNAKRPKEVILKIVSNETTSANLVLNGQVNIASVQGADRARLEQANVTAQTYRVPMGEFFFNQGSGRPAGDLAVRQAIVQGLNLEELGKVVTIDKGKPATSLVTLDPVDCPGDTVSGSLPAFDAAAAAAKLDSLGWRKNGDGVREKDGTKLELRIVYPTKWGQPVANATEQLATQLKALGVGSTLQALDSPALSKTIFSTGDYDLAWNIFVNNSPAPFAGIMSGASPKDGGQNFTNSQNQEYAALVAEASKLQGKAACELWVKAERSLLKNLDAVAFYEGAVPIFFKGVEGHLWKGSVAGWSLRTQTS